MEPLSTTVVAACAAATASAFALLLSQRRVNAWRRAAARLDWFYVSPFGRGELSGHADGFEVTFQPLRKGRLGLGTRIIIDGRRRIPCIPDLRAEGVASAIDRALGVREIEVGDPDFDAAVFAQGPEEVLLPLLDHETRLAVRALVALGGRVTDGAVQIDLPMSAAQPLGDALAAGLRAAASLRERSDAVGRLAASVRHDPCPAFRQRCVDLLARRYADDARAREAFRALLRSRSVLLRLSAAIPLGDEGYATLAEIAADPEAPEACAVRAIEMLGPALGGKAAMSILDDALRRERTVVALASVRVLGVLGEEHAVRRLSEALAGNAVAVAAAAAAALGATGDPSVEAPLVAALTSARPDVRLAVVAALGDVGTSAAVAPLHAAAEQNNAGPVLIRAARQAIARIQARLTGAAPGQVSLAEGGGGRLSLPAPAEAGRVCVVTDDATREVQVTDSPDGRPRSTVE